MKWYCDGSGWNGRRSMICVANEEGFCESKIFEKELTCNEAEYMAAIWACGLAAPGDTVFSDSRLVVSQTFGKWRCTKLHLQKIRDELLKLAKQGGVRFCWVSRETNVAGKELERLNAIKA